MKLVRTLLACSTLAAAAGCKGGTTTPTELVPGSYILQSINGQSLPFTAIFIDADNKLEFLSGNITIGADGTFSDATDLRVTQQGVATFETDLASGTWAQSGSTITFTPAGAAPYTLTWNGSTGLTQSIQGLSLVYVKL